MTDTTRGQETIESLGDAILTLLDERVGGPQNARLVVDTLGNVFLCVLTSVYRPKHWEVCLEGFAAYARRAFAQMKEDLPPDHWDCDCCERTAPHDRHRH